MITQIFEVGSGPSTASVCSLGARDDKSIARRVYLRSLNVFLRVPHPYTPSATMASDSLRRCSNSRLLR